MDVLQILEFRFVKILFEVDFLNYLIHYLSHFQYHFLSLLGGKSITKIFDLHFQFHELEGIYYFINHLIKVCCSGDGKKKSYFFKKID